MSYKDMDGQLDFLGLISEYTDDQGAHVKVRNPGVKRSKPIPPPAPEQFELDFTVKEVKAEPVAEVKAEVKEEVKEEPKEVLKEEPKKEPKEAPREEQKAKETVKPKPIPKAKTSEGGSGIMNFKQCVKCWCSDCKHNALGKAVPRDICGISMPCPACQSCIEEDTPTICEIGNAKEGCMTRALEEGLVVPE
jgi:hypothetical protein